MSRQYVVLGAVWGVLRSDMPLSSYTCNNTAAAARRWALLCYGRPPPDTNLFRRSQQSLREREFVTSTALVNAVCPLTARLSASCSFETRQGRISRYIAWILELPQSRQSSKHLTISCSILLAEGLLIPDDFLYWRLYEMSAESIHSK
jgi:hypothetical protein